MIVFPDWAKEMVPHLKAVCPDLTTEQIEHVMCGISRDVESLILPEDVAVKLREKFVAEGYELFEREEGYWMIESRDFAEHGIIVDTRYDSLFEEGTCMIRWNMLDEDF